MCYLSVDSCFFAWDDIQMSLHFWIIIGVQLLFFIFLFIRKRMSITSLSKLLILSSIFGVMYGFVFDTVFGVAGLFSYISDNKDQALYGTGLTVWQLVINGALSYGLAVATVYFIISKKITTKRFLFKKLALALAAVITLISSIYLYIFPVGIFSLFAGGLAVISFGEGVSIFCKQDGPFLSVLRKRNYKAFILFLLNCAMIGLLYELTNILFPFWVWLPGGTDSHLLVETLVVLFGYVVLLHPMVIFWQLVITSRKINL